MARIQLTRLVRAAYPQGWRTIWSWDVGSQHTRLATSLIQQIQRDTNTKRPIMSKGRFLDFAEAVEYLRSFRQELQPTQLWRELLPSGQEARVAVPNQAFPADRDMLSQIYRVAGWSQVQLYTKAEAHFHRFASEVPDKTIGIVIDVGAETTEFSVFSSQAVITSSTWYQGSDVLTKAIQDLAQQHYASAISWGSAEKIKSELVGVWPKAQEGRLQARHLSVRGKELASGAPTTVTVVAELLHTAYLEWYRELLTKVQAVIAVPTQRVALRSFDLKVWLSGGGGLLPGLDVALEADLDGTVLVSPTATTDVVRGLQLLP